MINKAQFSLYFTFVLPGNSHLALGYVDITGINNVVACPLK